MINYTGKIFGSIIVRGFATWAEFCKYKPNRVKQVGTIDGQAVFIHKSIQYNHARYWFYHCVACKRVGIIRADNLKRRIDDEYVCLCRRSPNTVKQRGILATKMKQCTACSKRLLASPVNFYQDKRGYLDSKCKTCRKAYQKSRYVLRLTSHKITEERCCGDIIDTENYGKTGMEDY